MDKPVEERMNESNAKQGRTFSLAVGIPTRGRPVILSETLEDLAHQTFQPKAVFVAYFEPSDISDLPERFPAVQFLRAKGLGGSCSQRNLLLDAIETEYDLCFIMDDDCYLHRDYLVLAVQTFVADPTVLGVTGRILENGAVGAGLQGAYARGVLAVIEHVPSLAEAPPFDTFNTDGCNMAFRTSILDRLNLRFDENMPGYAWYEDIDFSRQLLPHGRVVVVPGAQAIHLGAKVGKTSGKRYGYSQVANPIYLAKKGTYPWSNAFRSIAKNALANGIKALRPEPYIDRAGRLSGNLIAFGDALRGRLRPDRILSL
jgi:GT2 family glycosyltransferase